MLKADTRVQMYILNVAVAKQIVENLENKVTGDVFSQMSLGVTCRLWSSSTYHGRGHGKLVVKYSRVKSSLALSLVLMETPVSPQTRRQKSSAWLRAREQTETSYYTDKAYCVPRQKLILLASAAQVAPSASRGAVGRGQPKSQEDRHKWRGRPVKGR